MSSPSGVWGGAPQNLHFETFWDLKNRQNGQLAFESGGREQVNLGEARDPPAPT